MKNALRSSLNTEWVRGPTPESYDALRDDPIVDPPAYANRQAAQRAVPPEGIPPIWFGELNTEPQNRTVAGLGAAVVRRDQETLMAKAWQYAAGAVEANRILTRVRAAWEVARKARPRFDLLPDEQFVQLTGPAMARLKAGPQLTVKGSLANSALPVGALSASFRRLTHTTPGFLKITTAGRVSATDSFTRNLLSTPLEFIGSWASVKSPANADVEDPLQGASQLRADPSVAGIQATAQRIGVILKPYTGNSAPVLTLADKTRAALNPQEALTAMVETRIRGLSPQRDQDVPDRAFVRPKFTNPMYRRLTALGVEYLLPGAGDIPTDTLGLLATHPPFIEAFLAGLNHEMGREFLWREYPTRLDDTWFQYFWDGGPDASPDVLPMRQWQGLAALGEHYPPKVPQASLVLLVRSAILRRYPDLRVYAVEAAWENTTGQNVRIEAPNGEVKSPLFAAGLTSDISVYGFDLEADQARGSANPKFHPGYFFVLEQPFWFGAFWPRCGQTSPPRKGAQLVDQFILVAPGRERRAAAGVCRCQWTGLAPLSRGAAQQQRQFRGKRQGCLGRKRGGDGPYHLPAPGAHAGACRCHAAMRKTMKKSQTPRPGNRVRNTKTASAPTATTPNLLAGTTGRPVIKGGQLPDTLLGGAFSRLDPDLPLLLLPLRLETHYNFAVDPPQLQIRVYPEQIHIDADHPPGTAQPAHPLLLPQHWLAIGYGADGEQIFRQASRPIPAGLRTAPDPAAPTLDVSGASLALDAGLAWMVDFEEAVKVGMALAVPLSGLAAAALDQVAVLLVLGVQEALDPLAASDELARLLAVHSRTTGLAFVPQGTPTNNTESVSAGWSAADGGSARKPASPVPNPASPLGDNASQLAAALGFSAAGGLRGLEHGADQEALASQDMRTVLFEAVLGTLVRQLLDVGSQHGISLKNMNAVRDWFILNVTGGAPLPALRVGPQPYGILPVRHSQTAPDLTTSAGQVERIVALLSDVWRQSAAALPTLEEDPPDIDTAIATILAAQPHPARLFVRKLEEFISGSTPFAIQNTYTFLMDTIDQAVDQAHYLQGISQAALTYKWMLPSQYPDGFQSIDDQIAFCGLVEDTLRGQGLDQDTLALALSFMDSLLGILNSYEGRQHPVRWLGLNHYAGVLGELNTTLVAGKLSAESSEWGDAGLVQAPDAGASGAARDYLADLRQRFKARAQDGALGPPAVSPSPKPLLFQLLELSLPLVPNQAPANRKVLDALGRLGGLDPEQLEWLLRETLGLGAHRLDAWNTSLASERLARLRLKRPAGLQIGAFGWVTALQPRRNRRPSEGFIHAPSLAHATTAAMLRSGWLAHGSDDPSSPVAVDIRSAQVRTAAWLLDGVRQGQPLGTLLGYRFERSLHDLYADDQIQPVRQLVLAAQGKANASPNQPVDGIELLELYRAKTLGTVTPAVKNALIDLEAAFDAVEDVGLFEAVHQLAAGNYERATAMLDALATGAIAPPELRAPLTPRSAVAVEHRVVVLLRPQNSAPTRGWSAGIRDAIAPALEGWVASLLPPAGLVGFQASEITAAGQAGASFSLTLAQLGLSALDAIYLAGDDPTAVQAALRTLAAAAARTQAALIIDPQAGGSGLSLADFTLLASELRHLLESSRPLTGNDLRPAAAQGAEAPDPSAALDAVESLILTFDRLGDDLDEAIQDGRLGDMAEVVCHFARLGISTGASPQDVAAASGLMSQFQQVLARVVAAPVDPGDRQPGLEARLAALLGRRMPILGRFPLVGSAGGTIVDVRAGPASALEVDDWFDAVSRVRSEVGKLASMGLLSELLGAGGLALSAGQYPLAAGEGWAAAHLPAGAGRLSVVAASTPAGPPATGEPACGLFVDHWSEPVPSTQQVTGLAFQFDAPGNRAPQAWLLAVTPDGQPWSLKTGDGDPA